MYLAQDVFQKEVSRRLNRLLRLSQLILVCKFRLERNYWQRQATKKLMPNYWINFDINYTMFLLSSVAQNPLHVKDNKIL